jgi:hypothetical protein
MKKIGVCLILSLAAIFLLAGCGGSPVDQYEKLVDDMIPLLKKAQTGDMGAIQDLAKLQETAEELQEKLLESELSEAEQARLLKALEKLTSSAF